LPDLHTGDAWMVVMRPLGEFVSSTHHFILQSILFPKFSCLLSVSAFHIKIRTIFMFHFGYFEFVVG
jgi:hypothetical protein